MSVGFIGAGRIALAMSRGILKTGLIKPNRITASAPRGRGNSLMELKKLGANTTIDNRECVRASDIVFISVKADLVPTVLEEIHPVVDKSKLFISVAAGVTIDAIQLSLPAESRIIRAMTNTPCAVGTAATAFSAGNHATASDSRVAMELLSSFGYCVQLDESMLDAVCGLAGSGPAYAYVFIEALADGGVRMGLPRGLSTRLACEVVLGAARMVLDTGDHPSQLKDNVSSPGGSTICALHGLDASGFRGLVIDAVRDATLRTTELSELANQGIGVKQRQTLLPNGSSATGKGQL